MMIETFLGMSRYLSPRQDDDWVDRMHYLITPNILLAFSVLISFKQFGGHPIECMFPNKFPGSWEQYAENFCWSEDTYFVNKIEHVELLKKEEREKEHRQLSYYQWVPFFLLLQAAFFRAPSLIWKHFSNHSGIRIHEVVERAMDSANVEEDVKKRNIAILSKHLTSALRFQSRLQRKKVIVHKSLKFLNYQYSSGFISSVYMITKIIYLVNIVGQLYLTNYFLGTGRHEWHGFGVIEDLVKGVPWDKSGYFPRSAICDFEVRQVGNIQKYSVQCVLVINIFNEKIFLLLWFWYLILAAASIFSSLTWFILLALPCFSKSFISQHLELSSLYDYDPTTPKSKLQLRRFVKSYLHRDGIFVLRMVSAHAGIIFGTDLILSLWKSFYGIESQVSDEKRSLSSPTTIEDPLLTGDSLKKRKKSIASLDDVTTALIPTSEAGNKKDSSDSEDEKNKEKEKDG